METDKRQLLEAAKEAKKYSYAPYSNFHVGAACGTKKSLPPTPLNTFV